MEPVIKIQPQVSKPGDELGIDALLIVVAFIISTAYRLRELFKKFSYQRAIGLALFIGENRDLLAKGQTALKQLRDLSPKETRQLVDQLKIDIDLANDSLELRIERGLDLIPRGYELIKEMIGYTGEVKDWIDSWGDTDEPAVKELTNRFPLAA